MSVSLGLRGLARGVLSTSSYSASARTATAFRHPFLASRAFSSLTKHAHDLRYDNLDEELLDQKLAIVYAYDNGATSAAFSPVLEKAMFHTAATGKIHYAQLNLPNADQKLQDFLKVSKVPSLIVYQKGKEIHRIENPAPENLERELGRIAWLYTT